MNQRVKVADGPKFRDWPTTGPGQTLASSACQPSKPKRERHAPGANDQRLRLGELLCKRGQARDIAHVVADVLRLHGRDYLCNHALSTPQAKAWRAIYASRTAALGGQCIVDADPILTTCAD